MTFMPPTHNKAHIHPIHPELFAVKSQGSLLVSNSGSHTQSRTVFILIVYIRPTVFNYVNIYSISSTREG